MGKRVKLETYEFERIENNKECGYMVFKVNKEVPTGSKWYCPSYEYWVLAEETKSRGIVVTNINTGEGGIAYIVWQPYAFTVESCAHIILDVIFNRGFGIEHF